MTLCLVSSTIENKDIDGRSTSRKLTTISVLAMQLALYVALWSTDACPFPKQHGRERRPPLGQCCVRLLRAELVDWSHRRDQNTVTLIFKSAYD